MSAGDVAHSIQWDLQSPEVDSLEHVVDYWGESMDVDAIVEIKAGARRGIDGSFAKRWRQVLGFPFPWNRHPIP